MRLPRVSFVFISLSLDVVAAVSGGSRSRACAAGDLNFDAFTQTHGRQYSSEEYATRIALYEKNARLVREQNCQTGRRWTATLNKFSDWNAEELKMTFGELGVVHESPSSALLQQEVNQSRELATEKSWAHLDSLKDIMDQSSCGSCWAVGSATLLRAHAEIAQGKDPGRLSVQQLVSCVPNENECGGKGGCQGGTTDIALKYVLQRGLMKESEFPYKVSDSVKCPEGASLSQTELDNTDPSVFLSGASRARGAELGLIGYRQLDPNKMFPLMEALQTGPAKVSIGVPPGFHLYKRGVMDRCPKDAVLTHAALVTGYGESKEGKFWLMQNSWGPDWGDGGRFKFARGDADFEESEGCGVDHEPLKGNGCRLGPQKSPSSIQVCGSCGVLAAAVVPVFETRRSPVLRGNA